MQAGRTRTTVPRQTRVGAPGSPGASGSARGGVAAANFSSPGSPKRAPTSQAPASAPAGAGRVAARTGTHSAAGTPGPPQGSTFYEDEEAASSQRWLQGMSSSSPPASAERAMVPHEEDRGLFNVIEHLAALEAALWSILDGLKSNASYVSFFCREYWGTSASQAQLWLEKLAWNDRLKRQVQQACVLESLSLGVASHLCSGTMQDVSLTILSRLRNLLYYIHENCLVLLDLICQRWLQENPNGHSESDKAGHCPENLNLDILIRTNRYRQLRKGEHVMALRQHNEMIANVVRQLCRGAALRRPPVSNRRGTASPGGDRPGDRSPGIRGGPGARVSGTKADKGNILAAVNDILAARTPLERLRAASIRSKMLQYLCFKPLLNVDGNDPDCLWPAQDPYERYGTEQFAADGQIVWFEPLPPMLCNLKQDPKLPPIDSPNPGSVYSLVLDLDETLVHYYEFNGMGNYGVRPGMQEFLQRMSQAGYELVIFTAATQDYADWVIDQIDPDRLVHHRLYRQHALPWGPLFAKDLSRLGRDLDRTLIIDNVQENFMLQPHNGIFIRTWYEDPHDTALFMLVPLLEELIATRASVPEVLDKYRDQIPTWAGFDPFSQEGEYGEFDQGYDDGLARTDPVLGIQDPYYQQQELIAPEPQQRAPVEPPLGASALQHRTDPGLAQARFAPPVRQADMPQYGQPHRAEWEDVGLMSSSYAGAGATTQPTYGTASTPAAASPYVGASYAQRTGYPQQQIEPLGQTMPGAMPLQAGAPQRAARPATVPESKAAPSFSKVSGPFQAQAPPQAQAAHTPAPRQAANMWQRTGLGPHQVLQHGHR